MKKQLHENLLDFYKDVLAKYHRDIIEQQRQTDKVVVWITALSTGAIALILSQSEKLNIQDPIYLKISTALFLLSVTCGVLFRAFFYPLESLWFQKLLTFEGYCHGRTADVSRPIEIHDSHTVEDIAKSLKEDLGIDYDHWLEHDCLDRDFWVKHYNSWAEFWRKSEERGIEELSKAVAVMTNKDPEKAENIFKIDNESSLRKKITILSFVCNTCYYSLLLFFVLALSSAAIGYMASCLSIK